jgi:hypothetical protein
MDPRRSRSLEFSMHGRWTPSEPTQMPINPVTALDPATALNRLIGTVIGKVVTAFWACQPVAASPTTTPRHARRGSASPLL